MLNYMPIGIVNHDSMIIFLLSTSVSQNEIPIAILVGRGTKSNAIKTYTNHDVLKSFKQQENPYVTADQVAALHISVL
jgi:hypothetical protein